MIVDFASLIIF